jgi:hypothetical protein
VGTSYRREQVRFAGHTTESTEGWAVQQGAHDFRDERERGQHFVPMILVMIPGTTFPPTQDNIQQGCGVLPSLYSCAVAVIVCL